MRIHFNEEEIRHIFEMQKVDPFDKLNKIRSQVCSPSEQLKNRINLKDHIPRPVTKEVKKAVKKPKKRGRFTKGSDWDSSIYEMNEDSSMSVFTTQKTID